MCIRDSAGCALTTNNTNTIVGNSAGKNTCSGSGNTLYGNNAGCAINTGGCNTVVGRDAGKQITSGSHNNVFGHFAGCRLSQGSGNLLMGNCAGYVLCGNNNIMMGQSAGFNRSGTKYKNNVLVGHSAGSSAGTLAVGNFDVFVGYTAGKCYTGSCSIGIGHSVRMPITDGQNQLAIGQDTCHWITGTCDFNVGIGTTNPTSKLSVAGDACVSGVSTFSDTLRVGAGVTLHARGEAAFAGVVTFSAPTTNSNVKGAINLPYNRYITFGQDYIRGAIYHTGTQLYIQSLNAFKFRVWDGNGLKEWLNVVGVGGQVTLGGCDMGVTGSNKTHMFRLNPHKITMCSSVPDSSTQTKRFELDSYGFNFTGITTCLLYTSPSPRDVRSSRMPSSA